MKWSLALLATVGSLTAAAPASALCSGDTFEREYAEADLVVRARLVNERLVFRDEPLPAEFRERWGEELPVMLYRLEVSETFKGDAKPAENLFQVWYSGRFVMDQGQDYLLFLARYPERDGQPLAEVGAVYVRHACGQSRPWSDLNADVLAGLAVLPATRPAR